MSTTAIEQTTHGLLALLRAGWEALPAPQRTELVQRLGGAAGQAARYVAGEVERVPAMDVAALGQLQGVLRHCPEIAQMQVDMLNSNPGVVRVLVGAGAGMAGMNFLAVPLLSAVGFSAVGPATGSLAALYQSSIGSVSAGSLFAICQSAAMGGYGAAVFNAAGAGAGAMWAWFNKQPPS